VEIDDFRCGLERGGRKMTVLRLLMEEFWYVVQ
jgi:hypothetical protein